MVYSDLAMKILIIEDVDCLRKSLVDYLEDEGFETEATADGETGLAMALKSSHQAIILDLMLPGIDGYEVLEKLRASGSRVPVLLVTGRGALPDRIRGLDGGADDYLVKPFEMDELVARVSAIIYRASKDAALPNQARYTYAK